MPAEHNYPPAIEKRAPSIRSEFVTGLIFAGSLSSRGRRGRNYARRSQRQDNPEYEVCKTTGTRKEYCEQPHDPCNLGIKVKIVGQAGAHARNLFIGARAHQLLFAARCWREAWRSSFRLFGAAVVAKLGTNSDVFLAVYAIHGVTPPRAILPRVSTYRYADAP